jgi:2'-5' RNA ligase
MNWYEKFVISGKIQSEDDNFSWAYVTVSPEVKDLHERITNDFKEKDLYVEKKNGTDWSYGIEDDPHITLFYGFDGDDPTNVIKTLKGESGGNILIDDVDIFEKDEYDVLVAICSSTALQKLHKKLVDELELEDKFPTYKPHITLAYFKKGKAAEYKTSVLRGFTYYLIDFDFDEVIYEDTKDKSTTIKLSK